MRRAILSPLAAGLALAGLLLVTAPNAAAQGPAVTAPVVQGVPRVGETLTATAGDWFPRSFATASYQWGRCLPAGPCTGIPGATSRFGHTVTDEDVGYGLSIRLTVTRFGESSHADSPPTAVIPAPPLNVALPSLSGDARERAVLTASPGEWSGATPMSFAYRWQRCDAAGAQCEPIAGAAGGSYALSAADVGMTVLVVVTASSAGGEESATSLPAGPVVRAPLINLAPPAITGVAAVGRTLTATPGRWLTSGPLDFVYGWLRCSASGSRCDPIARATGRAYEVGTADVGFALRARVTAVSDAGSSTRDSALSALVTQSATQAIAPAAAALMRPFPRIRVKGYVTSSGAVLQVVRVRGPAAMRIALACRGRGCRFHHRSRRTGGRVRLRALEREWPAGVRLTIRVTKRALIGKYTRIAIRAERAPLRRDRCLLPAGRRPVPCPAPG